MIRNAGLLVAFVGAVASSSSNLSGAVASSSSNLSWIFTTNSSIGYCHMAMIERVGAPNSTVFAAAFQGARVHEGFNDQDIYFTRSRDGGDTWDPVRGRIARNTNGAYAVWGPVLHWDDNAEQLNLFFAQSGAFDQTTTPGRSGVGGDIMRARSADGGESWSAPELVLPYRDAAGAGGGPGASPNASADLAPKVTANKLVELADGAWLLPFWQTPRGNDTGPQAAGVLRGVPMRGGGGGGGAQSGERAWTRHMLWDAPTKLIENTLAVTRNGSLLMLFRTGEGALYEAWSHDGSGMAWSVPARSLLPNPNSKAFLAADERTGDLLLAYNPVTKGRNPLALARSADGVSWHQFANLDPGIKTKALEYPTTAQLRSATSSVLLTAFSADHYTGIKLAKTPVA
eukprot:g1978.t1